MKYGIFKHDPSLAPFCGDIALRMENYKKKKQELLSEGQTLAEFANGHHYFGFHKADGGWYYREWAPAADELYLTGDFCGWDRYAFPMKRQENGVLSCFLPAITPFGTAAR